MTTEMKSHFLSLGFLMYNSQESVFLVLLSNLFHQIEKVRRKKSTMFYHVRHQNSEASFPAFQKVAPLYHKINALYSQHTASVVCIILLLSKQILDS